VWLYVQPKNLFITDSLYVHEGYFYVIGTSLPAALHAAQSD